MYAFFLVQKHTGPPTTVGKLKGKKLSFIWHKASLD